VIVKVTSLGVPALSGLQLISKPGGGEAAPSRRVAESPGGGRAWLLGAGRALEDEST
jgi:hypothetical protein